MKMKMSSSWGKYFYFDVEFVVLDKGNDYKICVALEPHVGTRDAKYR